MKAVGYRTPLPVADPASLQDIELPDPVAAGRDLLVEVRAVSVNPLDTKLRAATPPDKGQAWKVLGFDAAGVVRAVGPGATLFKPGDRVWYAGSIARVGTNSELHLVDERIVGHMPASLDFVQAAALPLTTITAWEMLFDRLGVQRRSGYSDDTAPAPGRHAKTMLLIGAAGGVGSVMTQLASRLTDWRVIGTASRPSSRDWVKGQGAHDVIDHGEPLRRGLQAIGLHAVDCIVSLTHSDRHAAQLADIIAPQGKIGLIDDPKGALDINRFKFKSVSLHWETMFTRSFFNTPDIDSQHRLLNEAAQLVDAGTLRTTLTEHMGALDAATLRRAHARVESGQVQGKVVLG